MALLTVGTTMADLTKPAQLDPRRFNRHTFWCGQSGSGKTYALGIVLEQLLLHTELPMVIFDPNADYVRLNETTSGAGAADATRISHSDIRVFRSGGTDGARLHARYLDLSPAAKAAVLQIDPIADAEEYNVLLHWAADVTEFDAVKMIRDFRASGDPAHVRLANRMENLQVAEGKLWSRGAGSVVDVIEERPRVTVLDLGGFDHPVEPKVAALAVL